MADKESTLAYCGIPALLLYTSLRTTIRLSLVTQYYSISSWTSWLNIYVYLSGLGGEIHARASGDPRLRQGQAWELIDTISSLIRDYMYMITIYIYVCIYYISIYLCSYIYNIVYNHSKINRSQYNIYIYILYILMMRYITRFYLYIHPIPSNTKPLVLVQINIKPRPVLECNPKP